jgi:uracil-DNA glycosylase family 4
MSAARTGGSNNETRLKSINERVVACAQCPRLVEWRTTVAREKRAAYAEDAYWGRAVPSFGDPDAQLLIVGLAPGAHGSNRTGRMFTGDRSGEMLFRALHRAGFANQPEGRKADDGLRLSRAYITAAVRCAPPANRPSPAERDNCKPYLEDEFSVFGPVPVVVALGGFAFDQVLRILTDQGEAVPRPRPRFSHGVEVNLESTVVIGCYHPSQQNTFTGRLTESMFDTIWQRAQSLTSG